MERPGLFSGLGYDDAYKEIKSLQKRIEGLSKHQKKLSADAARAKRAYKNDETVYNRYVHMNFLPMKTNSVKISMLRNKAKWEELQKQFDDFRINDEIEKPHKDLTYWKMFLDGTPKGRKTILAGLKEWNKLSTEEKASFESLNKFYALEARLAVADRIIAWNDGVNRLEAYPGTPLFASESITSHKAMWMLKKLLREAKGEYEVFEEEYEEFRKKLQDLTVRKKENDKFVSKFYDGVPENEWDDDDRYERDFIAYEMPQMYKQKFQYKREKLMLTYRIEDLTLLLKNHPARRES